MNGKFKNVSEIVTKINRIYFEKDAIIVSLWIGGFGRLRVPQSWHQELQDYECSDFSGQSLSINITGVHEVVIRMSYNSHLLVWRVRKCN